MGFAASFYKNTMAFGAMLVSLMSFEEDKQRAENLAKKSTPQQPIPATFRSRGRKYWLNPRKPPTKGFKRAVMATHSDRPDPRHDKYLHAHARRRRAEQAVA